MNDALLALVIVLIAAGAGVGLGWVVFLIIRPYWDATRPVHPLILRRQAEDRLIAEHNARVTRTEEPR